MLYQLNLSDFPTVTKLYTVTRDTVWQITEREHLLLFVKEGSCHIRTSGEIFLLKKGDVCFLPADRAYVRTPTDGAVTLAYLHFTLPDSPLEKEEEEAVTHLVEIKEKLEEKLLSGEVIAPVKELLLEQFYEDAALSPWEEQMALCFSGQTPVCHLQASVILSAILAALSAKTEKRLLATPITVGTPRVPPKLKKALAYLASHPSEPVSPRDLARVSNVSPQQLVRYFRDAFGTTPVRYITEFKISRAKELLFYRTGLSVKEVARELGFDNQHYFSRVFTAVTGETPTTYRLRTWNYGKSPSR